MHRWERTATGQPQPLIQKGQLPAARGGHSQGRAGPCTAAILGHVEITLECKIFHHSRVPPDNALFSRVAGRPNTAASRRDGANDTVE